MGAGERGVYFFETFLRHSKGKWAGQPFKLLDWQRTQLIMPLLGWMRPDGTRRFRTAYAQVAKKNGKSTLAAGLNLYMLVGDGEMGAEVYCAAVDRPQAGIVFREAASMVKASPELSKRLEVIESRYRIVDHKTRSWFASMSKDSGSNEGPNPHAIVVDELHAHKDRRLFEALRYGGAARSQPLFMSITTAGSDHETICFQQYQYAKQVLSGELKDWSFFGYVAEPGEKDDWTAEETWKKANPSYGLTVTPDGMREACAEAVAQPAMENAFKRYRLNMWTEQAERWMPMAAWDACDRDELPPLALKRKCYAGLDLSSTQDFASLGLVFPPKNEGEKWRLACRHWIPMETAKKRQKAGVPVLDWGKAGKVIIVPGAVIDYDKIRAEILAVDAAFGIEEIAVDRWNSTQLQTQLMGDGMEVVQFGQGFASMTAPTKELMRLVIDGKLEYCNEDVLRWMMTHVAADTDAAGNEKPNKERSGDKIDGVAAIMMALGRAMVAPIAKKSKYATAGMTTLQQP